MNEQKLSNDSDFIMIKDFVHLLWKQFKPSSEDINTILHYGHLKGWLEDWDEHDSERFTDKKAAARILHQFMKIELGVPDFPDISPANVLADLYTCHTCVNHIAQVFLRGIITSQTVERDGLEHQIFNHLEEMTEKEIEIALERITSFSSQLLPEQILEKK